MSFFTQPSKAYRNFQIVFTILTLNFAIPTISYIFFPEMAHEQFLQMNAMLGGEAYPVDEAQSHFWRYLGAANVATLAFMCFLLQYNLRAFKPVLIPLTFMKSLAATLWLVGWIQHPEWRAFLGAAVLDYVTSAAFVYFALRAHSDIQKRSDEELVPRPQKVRGVTSP